MSILAS